MTENIDEINNEKKNSPRNMCHTPVINTINNMYVFKNFTFTSTLSHNHSSKKHFFTLSLGCHTSNWFNGGGIMVVGYVLGKLWAP